MSNDLILVKQPTIFYHSVQGGVVKYMARMRLKDAMSEYVVDFITTKGNPVMFAKKGYTVYVDGEQDGFLRVGGGSIARMLPRIVAKVATVKEIASDKDLSHDCYCVNCSRRTD